MSAIYWNTVTEPLRNALDAYLRKHYKYVSKPTPGIVGMGRSYILGESSQEAVKVDLYYTTDPFIRELKKADGIRLATLEEITATIPYMLSLHHERYPYSHDENLIRNNLTNFSFADEDFDPICLLGKHWEIIKSEIAEMLH